jgi:GTPase SAR1 family protein
MGDQAIQIAVIGDRAVGKTSIIRQWLYNDYSSSVAYSSTHLATYYFSSLFNGQRLFHIRIIDTPRFDENNHTDPQQDWVRMYCFRRAHLFLLVFDIHREETFHYIKQIYREIVRLRSTSASDDPLISHLSESSHDEINSIHVPVIVVANKIDLISTDLRFAIARDIQQFVKKNFQANTVFCSAKYHWHLVFLFKEISHMLETVEDTVAKQAAQQARRRLQRHQGKHCRVM